MGHDIEPVGNHNLNTSNVEALAKDICSRIDINIEFGYRSDIDLAKILGVNTKNEDIILGRIIKNESFNTYQLFDEYYQVKELLKLKGKKAIEICKDLKILEPELELKKNGKPEIKYQWYVLDYHIENSYANIGNQAYTNNFSYFTRWWDFCRFFTDYPEDTIVWLHEFRKELMMYTHLFGGNKMYILDDQSDVFEGIGYGTELEMQWDQLEKEIYKTAGGLLLDIPNFFITKAYENSPPMEYPLAFVDDWRDLK